MLFTCNPPFLLTASLYRYWQQRDAGGIAIGTSETGGIASSTNETGADWATRL